MDRLRNGPLYIEIGAYGGRRCSIRGRQAKSRPEQITFISRLSRISSSMRCARNEICGLGRWPLLKEWIRLSVRDKRFWISVPGTGVSYFKENTSLTGRSCKTDCEITWCSLSDYFLNDKWWQPPTIFRHWWIHWTNWTMRTSWSFNFSATIRQAYRIASLS